MKYEKAPWRIEERTERTEKTDRAERAGRTEKSKITERAANELLEKWKNIGLELTETERKAFISVPRTMFVQGLFVKEQEEQQAYADVALPIAHGQTISQPYTVMFMTHALEVKEDSKALEVGAGSGYQAAILGKIAKKGKVIAVEIIKELAESAEERIKNLGLKNVTLIHGDGSLGAKEHSPFDRIMITSACPEVPKPLIEQLNENGIIIAPIGNPYGYQIMTKIIKIKGKLQKQELGTFAFVPLRGKHGWQ